MSSAPHSIPPDSADAGPGTSVVTRFAPSPTGHLHIGGARTALFCWAWARRHPGGRFLLRIEDTDAKRSTEDAARGILDDLAWLGIEWDEGPTRQYPVSAAGEDDSQTIVVLGGDPRHVGPFFQSQRLTIYDALIERLLQDELAYPAFDTPEQLDAARRAAQAAKQTYRYVRSPDHDHADALARAASGEPHVVRFRMPDDDVVVRDEVLGEITFTREHFDDFVIRKRDGMPTYHFAVVVDDELMGVTHVLRGQEHLNNTPKHVGLQRALVHADGRPFRVPVYAHMPLIFNVDGTKMSKRDKDKALKKAVRDANLELAGIRGAASEGGLADLDDDTFAGWLKDKAAQLPPAMLTVMARAIGAQLPEIEVEDFRSAGYLPQVVCNFIALLGWSTGLKDEQGRDVEKFDMDDLAERFDLSRIGKTNAKFDRDKLLSFNMDAIAGMPPDRFCDVFRDWVHHYEPRLGEMAIDRFGVLAEAVRPQSKTLRDAAERSRFAIERPQGYDPKAVRKVLHKGEPSGLELLRRAAPVIAQIRPWSAGAIHEGLEAFCAAAGLMRQKQGEDPQPDLGAIAQPLRVAMTGTTISPAIDATLAVLGSEETAARIAACLAACAEEVGT